jgi:hypothetical protein
VQGCRWPALRSNQGAGPAGAMLIVNRRQENSAFGGDADTFSVLQRAAAKNLLE